MRHFVVNPIPGTSAQMQVYLHDPSYEYVAHSSRPCVVIFPGGSYRFTAEREAEPVALAFLHAGFQVCILRYSTRPNDELPFLGDTPMREGAVALHYIRANAASWCIDPEKVSVCGFSVGGHAAGCTGVFWKNSEAEKSRTWFSASEKSKRMLPFRSSIRVKNRGVR